MKNSIFVLYDAHQGQPTEPKFAFHAPNLAAAKSCGLGWARGHGLDPSDYCVGENPNYRADGVAMHDDWIPRDRRPKLLLFYKFQTTDSPRPYLLEAHLFHGKVPLPSKIRELLHQVADTHFHGDHYSVMANVTPPNPTVRAAYEIGAVSESYGLIVAHPQV